MDAELHLSRVGELDHQEVHAPHLEVPLEGGVAPSPRTGGTAIDLLGAIDGGPHAHPEMEAQPEEASLEQHAAILQDALSEKKQKDDALRVLELRATWAEARKQKLVSWPGEALDILGEEAKRGQLDALLLGVFVEAGVWRETVRAPEAAAPRD